MRRILLAAAASLTLAAVSSAWSMEPGKAETATASFATPDEWTVERSDGSAKVVAPEKDLFLAVVDVEGVADAGTATAAAWKKLEPGFARAVRLSTQRAGREGWDEIWYTDYEVSPDEKLVLTATAYRRGANWTVLLGKGSAATADKRIGQVRAMIDTIRPVGVVAENFAGAPADPFGAAKREALKSFWRDAMAAYGVPGMSYAFIDRNGIVEEGGIGVKTVGKLDPVDAHTRFMIASNTKGMTTLLLARMVDMGKMTWDERVVEAYPAFRMGDPAVQNEIRFRHLICACTGMPRQDLEWIMTGTNETPASHVFELLTPMKPTSKFGEVYQYSNLLASAAGYVAGGLLYPKMEVGAAYDRAMQELIFTPIGMKETTFSKAVAEGGNHADPHSLDADGNPAVGTIDKSDSIYFARPAGGAWSSAHDLALYALNELREGVLPDGKRIVSTESLLARRNQGMETGEATRYGMGIETTSRWGVPMVHHGGAMPGYKTDWVILPEAGVGVVMLFNSEEGSPILNWTRRRIVELLYNAREEAVPTLSTGAESYRADVAKERGLMKIPPDPVIAAKLGKRYENSELGFIDVTREPDGGLRFDFGSFQSRMATRANEDGTTNFVMIDPTLLGWPLSSRAAPDGAMLLVMQDGQHEYVYTPVR
ncbi:MAG TPA: serine hydrolase domain-containing protein [Sphingopyxis sp.]|jgi:CubicO group peptidase (beta-lactamase class C family)|uniref:serine hydrolase domain-containing protein n=1 Tax=Sphingopyxis sp. TaxID=1908224 RepID=UPI002E1573D1|nr:serine hydrolase domain-containing protein [Sphingopyxis sp.]